MKVTRLGYPTPILNAGFGLNAGGRVPPGGNALTVLTSDGSNGRYWGENVRRITANGSNTLLSPDVNFASGSNVTFSIASNTLTIHSTGGGSALTVADEGSPLATAATTLDFVGAGVTATGAGATKTVTIPGGAGGVSWTQDVNEDGSSFAAFTASTGTWASAGGLITQTDTGAAWRIAKYNTRVPVGFPWIIETEVAIVSAAGRAGIGLSDGVNTHGLYVYVMIGTGVLVDLGGAATIRTITATIAQSTTYKLRIAMAGAWLSVWLDGTLIGNVNLMNVSTWDPDSEFVTIQSFQASATWDNIKVWTLSGGAPA